MTVRYAFILFLVTFITLANSCPADIKNGKRFPNGTILSGGIYYKSGDYFSQGDSLRGCPCDMTMCLPKCCRYDHVMINQTCQFFGENASEILQNYTVLANLTSVYYYFEHTTHIMCPKSQPYRVAPLEFEDDAFIIQEDGAMYMLVPLEQQKNTFNRKEYCMDLFLNDQDDFEVSAIICIEDPQTHVSYDEHTAPFIVNNNMNNVNENKEITVGLKFGSYNELTSFLQIYEREKKQKFYKKRSRTIKSALKSLQRPLKASLEFYELEYACIHGQERSKRGNGLRQTSTLRLGCNANFKLRICAEGQYLRVFRCHLEHTQHELSNKVFDHLPQNRVLDDTELENVENYLSLDANKKKIQNKIRLEIGKKTTLKDLHNIHYKLKIGKNDLEETVNLLESKYHCDVNVLCDEEMNFKALQFSTESMRTAMNAWPEFVCVDGTYKLLNNGCTVFLCLVEDSNGQSEIVSVSLIAVEDRESYLWIFELFKTQCNSDKIICFMGDKDLTERGVIKEVFPGKPVYLCLFHTLKTFRREINCDKLNISKEERDLSLEYLQKLIYCNNEAEYNMIYTDFKESVPESVCVYFDKNWHPIRNEWLVCNMTSSTLNNRTNNRLESINHKIKQVVPKNSTLTDFVKCFFIFLDSHNQERDNRAAKHILKRPMYQFQNHEEDLLHYANILTSYSFKYVQKQIDLISKVKILEECIDGIFKIKTSSENIINATPDSCQCPNFTSMMLPCRHILAVRKHKNITLFAENLCHMRWTKTYYLSKQRIGTSNSNIVAKPTCVVSEKPKVMTLTEKRKSSTLITNSLVNLISMSSNSEFNYRLDLLKKIEHCWRIGKEVALTETTCDTNNDSSAVTYQVNENLVNSSSERDAVLIEAHNEGEETSTTRVLFDGELSEVEVMQHTTSVNNLFDNNNEDINSNLWKSIVLPPKIRKRGRPKGHDSTTVIGLTKPNKRRKANKFTHLKSQLSALKKASLETDSSQHSSVV